MLRYDLIYRIGYDPSITGELILRTTDATLPKDSRIVGSLIKAFDVLDAIRSSDNGLTLAKIRKVTGFDTSTVQRNTFTLVAMGYLVKDQDAGPTYRIAPRVLDLGFASLRQDPILRIALPYLHQAQEEHPYSVWLSYLDGDELLYVLRNKQESYMYSIFVGRRAPLYRTAGGRVVMSHMEQSRVDQILSNSDLSPTTPHTLVDIEQIKEKVDLARERGYSYAWQETRIGEVVAASAILNQDDEPIGAIHASASIKQISKSQVEETIALVAMNVSNLVTKEIKAFGL